ncbi:hypothetical protein [Bosea thiooxidans]
MELSTAQKVIVASVVILVLLALLGLFVRQIQGGRLRLRGQVASRQRQPRLGVVDTYDLDRQRQLVLIRRDNIEHLVMIGGASDVVVETNILRSGGRSVAPSYADTAMHDRPLPPFETLVPPSEPMLRADETRRTGTAEAPDMLPPLPSRASSQPDFGAASAGVAAALGVSAPTPAPAPAKPAAPPPPASPVTTGPAPSFAREHAPPPPVSPGELDDMTRQLEEALKRPFSAVRPANLPDEAHAEGAAPPVKPPVAAAAPAAPSPAVAPRPEPRPAPKVVPAAPHIPVMPPSAPPRQDPFPSVEAELAAALGLSPEPAAPKVPEPRVAESRPAEPKAAEPKPAVQKAPDSKAAEARPAEPRFAAPKPAEFKPAEPKPAEPMPAEPKPAPARAEPKLQPAPAPQPAAEPRPEPPPAPAEPEPPVVEAKPEPKPQPKPEPEKPAAPPEPKEIDPFSVDAIEAEFARLLGRGPKDKS